jgi:hypothetical protein
LLHFLYSLKLEIQDPNIIYIMNSYQKHCFEIKICIISASIKIQEDLSFLKIKRFHHFFIEYLNTILNLNQTKQKNRMANYFYNICLSQSLGSYYQSAYFKIHNFLKCKRMKIKETLHTAMISSKKI